MTASIVSIRQTHEQHAGPELSQAQNDLACLHLSSIGLDIEIK